MTVKRIVPNIKTEQIEAAKSFYGVILGLTVVMDLGFILTFQAANLAPSQISFATEGGSGTQVPDLSIEVDNFKEVYQRVVDAGFEVEYGPVKEPWGVERFYVRDPFDKLVNILTHIPEQ